MPKSNKINIFFCIFLVVCIIFVSVAPIYILPKVYKNYSFDMLNREDGVFLELWEVDTFEGGTNSRSMFLENVAIAFEKKNSGVFVVVRNLTLDQLKLMLSQEKLPDMLSFGIGAGELVRAFCNTIEWSGNEIRNTMLESGAYKNQQLAIPWCMGGYVLCSTNTDVNQEIDATKTFGVGVENNVPPNNDFQNVVKLATQYDAYKEYLAGNFDILIGTQRDFYRVSNKVSLGVMGQNFYHFVDNYTDLVQYLSVTTKDEKIQSYATSFAKFLVGAQMQSKLKNIGMFSVGDESIFKGSDYEQFETAIMHINKFQNVFEDNAILQDKKQKLYTNN